MDPIDPAAPPDAIARARRVFEIEIEALQALSGRLDSGFAQAVTVIRQAVTREKKVIVAGIGKSSHIGEKIAATLTSTGTPAMVLNSMNALHGDLGIVRDGDVVLALSYSGETDEMINLLPALRRFDLKIISLTGNPRSTLARYSDVVLDVSVQREACPLALAPTASTTAMLVLGDALSMVLLEAAGFREEDFARYHPAGMLGRKLLCRARDIMRGLDQMALVPGTATVDEAIELMVQKRGGAAVVVEPDGRLAGIFTHGDFVRAFRAHGGATSPMPVNELMTRRPISTTEERLAVEVLGILKQHRIDEIVVLNEHGQPVGIIDVQDLSRFGLL